MAAGRALRRLSTQVLRSQQCYRSGNDPLACGYCSVAHFSAGHDEEEQEQGSRPVVFQVSPPRSGSWMMRSSSIPMLTHNFGPGYYSRGAVRFCSSVAGDAGQLHSGLEAAQEVTAAAATFASEIEAATSASYPWTATLQQFINLIHVETGLPWWVSIALATVCVRALVFPITVYQMKLTARFSLLRPDLEKIKAEIAESNYDPAVVEANKKKMNELFERHKTNPFTPLIGALIQAPLFMCFFFGIRTMAEKMESFKTGGALWFTDLSSSDPYYLLPVLTGLTFLVVVELGTAEGMQGQPNLKVMKNIMRGCGVLLVPLTINFPMALFSYWLTSNMWTMAQGAALRNPRIKTILDIPETSHLDPARKAALQQVKPVISFAPPLKKKHTAL